MAIEGDIVFDDRDQQDASYCSQISVENRFGEDTLDNCSDTSLATSSPTDEMPALTQTIRMPFPGRDDGEMKGSASNTPVYFQERISVGSNDEHDDRFSASFCDIVPGKRFVSAVTIEPTLTPIDFQDRLYCYVNSSRKRFKSSMELEPRPRPREFTDRMYLYPKRPVHTYVSVLEHTSGDGRKWYKNAVQLQAKTFTTTKLVNVTSLNYNGTGDFSDKIIQFPFTKDLKVDSNGNTSYVNGYVNGVNGQV